MKIKLVGLFLLPLLASPVMANAGRFYLEGDGTLKLLNAKTGAAGEVTYRRPDGTYDPKRLSRIYRIFGAPHRARESVALRLVSLLDHLQDTLQGGTIRIISGYRSPEYNEGLRKKGRLAARTSLHIEGMAADIEIEKVKARRLWEFVRNLDCCGAGYYHGDSVHLDTGPTRFWDETSTGVEKDLGARNKLVMVRTEFDNYQPGEKARLTLARITDYPISIAPEATLIAGGKWLSKVTLAPPDGGCVSIRSHQEARSLAWEIPRDLRPLERVQIRLAFCEKEFPEMPDQILSNPISIRSDSF